MRATVCTVPNKRSYFIGFVAMEPPLSGPNDTIFTTAVHGYGMLLQTIALRLLPLQKEAFSC
jgi:hypothetical protein